MQPLATMECEDCGTFVIAKPEGMTVFFDGRKFYAMSICGSCERPISDEIEDKKIEVLSFLLNSGVRIFSWVDGREIKTEEMLEAICNVT